VSVAQPVRSVGLALALIVIPALATGQQPELRVDVLGPKPYSLQAGVAAIVPLGYYVRLSAGTGYAPRANASLIDDHWRADLVARVTLDPFREQRWALSIGGGLSVRRHTYLAAIADLEGPEIRGMLPALQVGLSGGPRVGLVLRRAVKGRR
jgi:hypothetical protein